MVTSTIAFEGEGRLQEYVGGYDDWVRQRRTTVERPAAPAQKNTPAAPREEKKPAAKSNKLSYKDQRELDALPKRIEALEAEVAALHAAMGDPAFYQQEAAVITEARERLEAVEQELAEAYGRWEALEG